MNKSKIDWCDYTWNPVTGCLNDCPYCYARKIANRFKGFDIAISDKLGRRCDVSCVDNLYDIKQPLILKLNTRKAEAIRAPYPYGFKPTFHRYRLDEPLKIKKPSTIFVCSMADLFGDWIPDEWIKAVFEACEKAPQHRYLFLTKNPDRYTELAEKDLLPRNDNFWYGTTVTRLKEDYVTGGGFNMFVSFEPLLEECRLDYYGHMFLPDWIIIGAETGNRKGKVIPQREWIEQLIEEARYYKIPVFLKDNLKPIWGENLFQELPWEV